MIYYDIMYQVYRVWVPVPNGMSLISTVTRIL